jgi:hypothetical protein
MTVNSGLKAFDAFRRLAATHFGFLFDEYGFVEAEARMHPPGMWIHYRNDTSQVSVHFEYGADVWVTVGRLTHFEERLVGGEQYNLDVLLSLRAPDLELKEEPFPDFDEMRIGEILANRAVALRYAADVLRGNFDVFPELARITEERFQRRIADFTHDS